MNKVWVLGSGRHIPGSTRPGKYRVDEMQLHIMTSTWPRDRRRPCSKLPNS